MNYLEDYYNQDREEGRLLSQHGRVEYLTTQKYIHAYLGGNKDAQILEIGAGTGRYSVALAKEGYSVAALELVAHNLDVLRAKLDGTERIEVCQGNALDLSRFEDDRFDLTLVLGPMYHLYTKADKIRALSEAVRVTKPGGVLMVAYCMNEATIIQYVFAKDNLRTVLDKDLLTPDWLGRSDPEEIFELIRTEGIDELNAAVGVRRLKLVATDGATNYLRDLIDGMDEAAFAKWMEYHLATCERQDLIGASNHTLDILRKE